MKTFRSLQLDLWSARVLRLVVALCASLIAACGGGYGGGSGSGGMSSSAPTITTQPMAQSVHAGQVATFSVVASGPSGYTNFTYQWMRQSSGMMAFTAISGATGASYMLTTALSDNGASFKVNVTNGYGTTPSSSAMLTVMP